MKRTLFMMNLALLMVLSTAVSSDPVQVNLPDVEFTEDNGEVPEEGEFTVCNVDENVATHTPEPEGGQPSKGAHIEEQDKIVVSRATGFGKIQILDGTTDDVKSDVSMLPSNDGLALVGTKEFEHSTGPNITLQNHLMMVTFIPKENFPTKFPDGEKPDGCEVEPATGMLNITVCWEGRNRGQAVWRCEVGPHLGHVHAQD